MSKPLKTLLATAVVSASLLTAAATTPASAHWVWVHRHHVWVQDRHLEWRYWHPAQRHYWHAHHYPYYR